MNAYMVRLADSHEVVGIFVARSIDRLWWAVDECTSPQDCEYRKLGEGGVFVPGRTSAQWPTRTIHDRIKDDGGIHPDDEDDLRGAILSEEWAIYDHENVKWTSLERTPLNLGRAL